MKTLTLEQMEKTQGGLACFFVIPVLTISLIFLNLPLIYEATDRMIECWNS